MPAVRSFSTKLKCLQRPTLRASLRAQLDGAAWPASARWAEHGDMLIDGVPMTALAAAHGTPVHVLSESGVRARCADYVTAFGADAAAKAVEAATQQMHARCTQVAAQSAA